MRDSKAWVRQWIAIMSMIMLSIATFFALVVEVDMVVYGGFATICTGYIGWFFRARDIEKGENYSEAMRIIANLTEEKK